MVALIYDQRNMLLRRDDAARDSGGIGKPQGLQGGAKACPAGLSLPLRSPESRSLIYWRIPGFSLTPLRAFFIVGTDAVFPFIYSGNYPQ